MKQCRKLLEEDMGLPEKALDSDKAYVKELVEKVDHNLRFTFNVPSC